MLFNSVCTFSHHNLILGLARLHIITAYLSLFKVHIVCIIDLVFSVYFPFCTKKYTRTCIKIYGKLGLFRTWERENVT